MSGHLRFYFVAFLLVGLSTSPASSNPFDALFNSAPAEATAPAPAETTAPAPTEEGCLPQPGKSTAEGQHWVYRYDGHRKCWFQAAEATVKKSARHAAKPRAADPKENDSAPRNRRAVVDARTELLGPAPSEAPQPTPPAPRTQLVDAAPVPLTADAAPQAPASVVTEPATNRLTADQPMPRQVDVDALLAAAPPAGDAAATVPPASQVAGSNPDTGGGGGGWTATWPGLLLMALGLALLLRVLRASRTVRVDGVVRAISPSVEGAGGHRRRRAREPVFAFGPARFDRPADKSLFRPRNARPAI